MILSVFGTLMKGHGAHHLLGEAKFLGKTRIAGFRMFDAGFPFIFEAERVGGGQEENPMQFSISAEVYEIDSELIRSIDRYEGCPSLFERKQVDVEVNGKFIKSFIYVAGPSQDHKDLDEIKSGDFNHRLM